MLKLIRKQKVWYGSTFFLTSLRKCQKKPFFKRYQFALRILQYFIFVLLFYYSVHYKATYLTLWTDDSPLSRSLNEQNRYSRNEVILILAKLLIRYQFPVLYHR